MTTPRSACAEDGMTRTAVLALDDVTLRYGGWGGPLPPPLPPAVDSLCLEVAAGEVFGLLGPNGCGKSTTLTAVAGALAPATGDIRVCGRREADDPLAYRRLIGLVPQELALYDELTVEQNVVFFGRLYGLGGAKLRQKVAEVVDFVRLRGHERRTVRALSGGMQRRLNLACALLHDPPLLLLDEPTVGLDVQARDAIFASLRELRDRGRALVFTTHHLHEAQTLCDRIGIMDRGRLLAAGTLAELRDELFEGPDGQRWQAEDDHVPTGPASLERVFLELTRRSPSER
jgi:ABC-2 type transport system ATP-binding protein